MNDHWVLIGKVVGGVKQAAYFTQLDWVQEQCADKLGFRPYPGTLNLEISKESLPELEDLRLSIVVVDDRTLRSLSQQLLVGTADRIGLPADDLPLGGGRKRDSEPVLQLFKPVEREA